MPLPRHLFEPIPLPASSSKPEGPEAPSEQIAMAPPPADLSERMDKQRHEEAWLKERKVGRAAAERARIERMPVTSIHILGRHANSSAPENALHMYIDITHVEHGQEHHEILEADGTASLAYKYRYELCAGLSAICSRW